jgi:hypothetical protein
MGDPLNSGMMSGKQQVILELTSTRFSAFVRSLICQLPRGQSCNGRWASEECLEMMRWRNGLNSKLLWKVQSYVGKETQFLWGLGERDTILWGLSPRKKSTTSSLYKFLTSGGVSCRMAKKIWKCKIPLKIKVFVWKVLQDRVQTAQQLKN